MRRTIAAAALLMLACSKPAPNAPAEYRAPDGSFTAALPGGWKVDDGPSETRKAAFFGPPDGAAPFSETIRVSLIPGMTPQSYRASRGGGATPLVESEAGENKAVEFSLAESFPNPHGGTVSAQTRFVLIESPRGLFVLEHARPTGAQGSPAFADLLGSFKPGR